MLKIEFSEADVKALHYERYHHPHPRVQRKMDALYLKSPALSHQEICHLSGITGNTLRGYLRDYQRGGIEQLKQLNFHRPESALMRHRTSLEDHFQKHPSASVNQAQAVIEGANGHRTLTHASAGVSQAPRAQAAQGRDDPSQGQY
jgi:hypothetical protein